MRSRAWLWTGLALGGAYLLISSTASGAEPPPKKREPTPKGDGADVIDLGVQKHREDESEGSGSSIRAGEG